MTNLANVLVVLASLGLGIAYAEGYATFEGVVVWLLVYTVMMLVDIKTSVGGNA